MSQMPRTGRSWLLTAVTILAACQPTQQAGSPSAAPNSADTPKATGVQTPKPDSAETTMTQAAVQYQAESEFDTRLVVARPLAIPDQKMYGMYGMLEQVVTHDGRRLLAGKLGRDRWYLINPQDGYLGNPLTEFRVNGLFCFVGQYYANVDAYTFVPSQSQTPVFQAVFLRADGDNHRSCL